MPHRDIDHLAKALLASAKAVLTTTRSLPPFGAEMLPDGEVITRCTHGHGTTRPSAGRTKSPGSGGSCDGERGNAKSAVSSFEREFRTKAAGGEVRAVAICMSVTTPAPGRAKKVHAICVSVEHESGEALDFYAPYRKGWFGRFSFDEVFWQKRSPRIFKAGAGTVTTPSPTTARTLGGVAVNRIQLG